MTTPITCEVLVRQLGKVGYSRALALQKSLAAQYREVQPQGEVGELLLCEHDPVYTFGLRQCLHHQAEAARLRLLGCETYQVRRGGLTTFHGPGQLVCYPVLNLRKLKKGAREYVRCLEQAVIATLTEFGVEGFTTCNTGVWVTHPVKGESKICSLGIQVSHGVCFHGLAINCCTDLSWFQHIIPCGVEGKGVTSVTEMCKRRVTIGQVEPLLTQHLARTVGFKLRS